MGLNDDVDEGLNLELDREDAPDFNPNLPIPEPIVIVTDTNLIEENPIVDPEDLFGIGAIKNEVPNINAVYETVKELTNVTQDLANVRDDISHSNGISKEDAELVDSLMGDFIDDKKPLGFFTVDKTKTQFEETLYTLGKRIDTNITISATGIKNAADDVSLKVLPLLKNLPMKAIEGTQKLQAEISNLAKTLSEDELTDKFSFEDGTTITNILESNAYELNDHSDDSVEAALKKYSNWFEDNANRHKVNCLFSRQLYGFKKNIFCIGSTNSFYELVDQNPFLVLLDEDLTNKLSGPISLHQLIASSVSEETLETITKLLGVCSNMMTFVGQSPLELEAILTDEELDQNTKLNKLLSIGGFNSKIIMVVVSIITFIEQYILMLQNLQNLLNVIVEKTK